MSERGDDVLRKVVYKESGYDFVPVHPLVKGSYRPNSVIYMSGHRGASTDYHGYIKLPVTLGALIRNKSSIRMRMRLRRTRYGVREDLFTVDFSNVAVSLFGVYFQGNNTLMVGGRSVSGDAWQGRSTITTFTDTDNYFTIDCLVDLSSPTIQIKVNGILQPLTSNVLSFGQTTFNPGPSDSILNSIGSRQGYGVTPFIGYIDWFELYANDELIRKYEFNEGYEPHASADVLAYDSSGYEAHALIKQGIYYYRI